MEITFKEYLADFQEKLRTPLRIREVKTVREGKIKYIYIITNRETEVKEGLKLALPYLLEGIANVFSVYELGITHNGLLYLIADDKNEEDLGILYHDIVINEELPGIDLAKTEELSRYVFFCLIGEDHNEAYIIPEDLLRRDPQDE